MNEQEINHKLKEVYIKFRDDLMDIKNYELNSSFSAPLLMNINEEYVNSKTKVLLVGQETCGWGKINV